MAQSLAVVCEGAADQRTGCDLADRVFCARIDWVDAETLLHHRTWRGFKPHDPFLSWADVKRLAVEQNVKSHGFFDGQPAAHDAHAARKALLLLEAGDDGPDAVILLRDQDGDPLRRDGLEAARQRSKLRDRVAIGLAEPMRECWVLAGFEAQNDTENDRLNECKRELGFDPREDAEKLTAQAQSAKRSPKRVLKILTGGNRDREAECWNRTDLATLVHCGRKSGLAEYLDEIGTRIVPLLTSRRRAS